MRRLVIGLGCGSCGDDGVGPVVAGAVRELRLPDVHVVAVEDPAELVPLWGGAELVVVVDAIAAGGPPGSLTVVDLTARLEGAAVAGVDDGWMRGGVGRYAFGLAAAVQLGRALHRLPERLVLVGVEGSVFAAGAPLSPVVADAVRPASRAVAELVALEPASAGSALGSAYADRW
ncbi:hydrogenase maturation protease [Actinotalea ferrariae CF5-4]|uniref:Hydrogenase maturation protease n=1 Tax=Actinotalea ferrariae CF5-4 TaxID=948458 RepID=A0A021VRD8_9CELL|nr:hydrogenase maturation protease [Actinotalea ferrariae]EYR63688.1 hydrogenase maturation protease [Actinotalea ferrariae CF5-4]